MANDPFSDWRRAWLDAHDAGVTMMMRAFSIQRAILNGDWTGGPEARSMVPEKIAEAQEGLVAAGQESLRAVANAARMSETASEAKAEVAAAATGQARKKTRSAAKRPSSPKKKRSTAKKAKTAPRRK